MTISISGGRIDRVDPSAPTRLIIDGRDLGVPSGALVIPGLVDTHCHLVGLGMMASRVQLGDVRTATDCASRVALRAWSTPEGEWVLGFGWNETEWIDHRVPHRSILDAVAPDHPVALFRVDVHAVWVNSRAIERLDLPDHIDGGEVVRDEHGEPTGLLIDNAMEIVRAAIPAPDTRQVRQWIAYGGAQCASFGLTGLHDMNVGLDVLEGMVQASDAGELPQRVAVFLEGQTDAWRGFGAPRRLTDRVDVVGVKYFVDGALGSRGALLLEPYADAPDTIGLQLMGADELVERAAPAVEAGHVIATHAIGDAGVRITLDAYERLRARYPHAILRVEHSQIVHPDDLPRFAALDVVAAVQPTHCTSDAAMAEARLGPERCRTAYRWRSLIDAGAVVIAGSDFPIESADPLPGLRAFVDRIPRRGDVAWFPEERITRHEALAAFTDHAPRGLASVDRPVGLAPGAPADLVVIDGDPFEEGAIVLATLVEGQIVAE